MAIAKSKADLEVELDEANEYIDQLEGKLNDIVGIAAEEDDDLDEGDSSDEEEGEDDDSD